MLKEGGEMTANSDMGGVIKFVPVSPDFVFLSETHAGDDKLNGTQKY